MMTLLQISALAFSTGKHAGQKRRGGKDYITHPVQVAEMVHTERQKVIALLHDTLEDTDTTYNELLAQFGKPVADAVDALTRRKGETHPDYIKRVKTNADAVQVKIADITCNVNDLPTASTRIRYADELLELRTI